MADNQGMYMQITGFQTTLSILGEFKDGQWHGELLLMGNSVYKNHMSTDLECRRDLIEYYLKRYCQEAKWIYLSPDKEGCK